MPTATFSVWRDTGFTEGCIEHPSVTNTLSTPDFTFTDLHPSRSKLFTSVQIPVAYEDIYDCSYLRASFDMNNGDDVVVYGWIDDVYCSSDNIGSPMCIIDWHVDFWRTYLGRASFGSGMVLRRPSTSTIPPQEYPNRWVETSVTTPLVTPGDMLTVILKYTITKDGVTTQGTLAYPVSVSEPDKRWYVNTNKTIVSPSLRESLDGSLDEFLGLDPDAIYAIFLSPVSPNEIYTTGSIGEGVSTMIGWQATATLEGTPSHGGWKPAWFNLVNVEPYKLYTKDITAVTTDTESYIITDFNGSIVGTLPWGLSVTSLEYRIIETDQTMYLGMRFKTATSEYNDAGSLGLEYNIPLSSLGLTSNARSSYLYSGQQDFDRSQMQIQREQALYSGLVNIGTGGIQGAMAGATAQEKTQWRSFDGRKGGVTGNVNTTSLAGAGAVAGMAGQAVGALGDYLISGVMNDRMMDITMTQKSKQTAQLTLPSQGVDWLINGRALSLVGMSWDDYSIEQRNKDISLYGAHVQEPMSSCQSLIDAGGALQIMNLSVTGDMPVIAKNYLRNAFASGVRII